MWHGTLLLVVLLAGTGQPELSQNYVETFLAKPWSSGDLILEATIADLGKMQDVCLVSIPQQVTFRINRVLWGEWARHTIQVGYGGCRIRLPSPPFTKGARLIVFAHALGPLNTYPPIRGNEKNIVGTGVRWGLFPATDENTSIVIRTIAKRSAQ